MNAPSYSAKRYLIFSGLLHAILLVIFVVGLDFEHPPMVVENTDQHDIMSAVVLGETEKSKILNTEPPSVPAVSETKQETQTITPEPLAKPLPPKPKPAVTPVASKHDLEKEFLKDLKEFKKTKNKQAAKRALKEDFKQSLRAMNEKTMRNALLNEKITMKSTLSQKSQGIVNRYQALIQQAISEHWVIPPGAKKKAYSILLIRLSPKGTVLDVQIATSSGDPALDYSARAAVFKASPLPVPEDKDAFQAFKAFRLKARPENILNES